MRRSFLVLVALLTVLGGVAAASHLAAPTIPVLAHDDDCDSSGPGSGDCDDDSKRDDHDDDSGHGRGGDDDDDDDPDVQAARTALAQPVGPNEIRIVDERFVPNAITIRAGESVTFVNADDDEHTATGPGFDTGKMLPGDRVTIRFDTPGTFDFVCQFHADMQGQVIVEGDATPVASPVASPAPAAVAAGTVDMAIVDFAFQTPDLTIPPGTEVTWTNTGVAPHTVSGLATESGTLQTGQSFSFVFDTVGTFDYRCAFHPEMVGKVTVAAGAPLPGA